MIIEKGTRSFSEYAGSYDNHFSNSTIGKMQRARVWHFLKKYTAGKKLRILELNCGTGIDAAWLAKQGHSVLATDAASGMIEVAIRNNMAYKELITFKVCDINHIETITDTEQFDLVFSDFSGLNCIDAAQLKKLGEVLDKKLVANGKIIACVFGTSCLWEKLYFLFKLDFKKINRRKDRSKTDVMIQSNTVTTWYYSPSTFSTFFKQSFKLKEKMPVGLYLPPSYLNNLFSSVSFLLPVLNFFERHFAFPFLSNKADHYIVCLEKN